MQGCSLAAVAFILLIQFITAVVSLQCPANLSKECDCKTIYGSNFVNCSKNGESISIRIADYSVFKCENVSNGEILKSINFDFIDNIEVYILKIESCPLSAFTLIEDAIFTHMSKLVRIMASDSVITAMPETIFNHLSNVATFSISGWLTTLPEKMFKSPTNLENLDISGENLISLPEKVFTNINQLLGLTIRNSKVTELPEKIFKDLNELGWLHMSRNKLTELPNEMS